MTRPAGIRMDSAPYDEVGTPDHMLKRCSVHDVLYRVGDECLDCEREEA